MITTDDAIELLLILPSRNTAEEQVSLLRNAGLAVHPTFVTAPDQLTDTLQRKELDLIVCDADGDPSRFLATIDDCRKQRPELPIVILYAEQDPDTLLQALQNGARDVVAKEDPEHLALVVRREYDDLLARRALHRAEERLRETEARCTALMTHSRDAIAYIHEGMHVRANGVYLELFGIPDMEEIEGLPILDMIAADDLDRFKRFLRSPDAQQGELEIRCRNSDGDVFDARLEFSPASIEGEACTQIIIRDRSAAPPSPSSTDDGSGHSDTDLLDLPRFDHLLQERMDRAADGQTPLALLYLCIDQFSDLRSQIGLTTSNLLSEAVADILLQCLGEEDIAARSGDHAFTILTPVADEQAGELATRILRSLEHRLPEIKAPTPQLSCSIGITAVGPGTVAARQLLDAAYRAWERAAEDASHVAFYRPQDGDGESSTADAEGDTGQTLEIERIHLVYQPVICLEGESRELYAIFGRLRREDGTELPPKQFLPLAENMGKMEELDRHVLLKALDELVRQRSEGRKVCFLVPLSEASVRNDELLLWICDRLREHKVRGAWLIFRIQEGVIRANPDRAKRLIEDLRKIKCQITVDHYGIANEPETLLQRVAVDYVRFDASFAQGLTDDHNRRERLTEMNKAARELGVRTIFTGVEDANTLAVLWTVGVNYVQGDFLQEPSEQIAYDFSAA